MRVSRVCHLLFPKNVLFTIFYERTFSPMSSDSPSSQGVLVDPSATSPRRSPRSPLNLSDLSSSSASENSSLTDVVATRHDLEAKLVAARQTRQQYQDRVAALESEIRELNSKADITLQILDDRKESLSNANDLLQEELDNLPPLDYLEEQLRLMAPFGSPGVRRIIEHEDTEAFPTDDLIMLGVLHPGESRHLLPRRIDEMIDILRPQPRTDGVAIVGDGTKTTEKDLRLRIDLQRMMRMREERAKFEIDMEKADVRRLERRESDLMASPRSGSASVSMSPRGLPTPLSPRSASGTLSARASPKQSESSERARSRQRQSLPLPIGTRT